MIANTGKIEIVNLMGNLSTPIEFGWIAYGTGTTSESAGRTILTTETDRAAATVTIISVYAPHDTMRFSNVFDVATGVTVTEIAVFNAASTGDMIGRKLLDNPVLTVTGGKLIAIYDFPLRDGEVGD